MAATGDLMTGASTNGEHDADQDGDYADHPEDRETGDEADHHQYGSKNNHEVLPSIA
jgi:hypothetical protein